MKKIIAALLLFVIPANNAGASPWAEKTRYRDKIEGKFVFGLKHSLFSWMTPWAEAHDPKYETPWTGFSVGIGKAFVYTAAGLIQLVTFPIPLDFPDIGLGMHIPANHPRGGRAKQDSTMVGRAAVLKTAPASPAVPVVVTPATPVSAEPKPAAAPAETKPAAVPSDAAAPMKVIT